MLKRFIFSLCENTKQLLVVGVISFVECVLFTFRRSSLEKQNEIPLPWSKLPWSNHMASQKENCIINN